MAAKKQNIPKKALHKLLKLLIIFIVLIAILFTIYVLNVLFYPSHKEAVWKDIPLLTDTPTPSPFPNEAGPYEPECKNLEKEEIDNDKYQWLTLYSSKLGLSFKAPVPQGKITFIYDDCSGRKVDPTGKIYQWTIENLTNNSNQSWLESAGGVSRDFTVGRERWLIENYQISKIKNNSNVKIFRTKYDTDAVFSLTNFSTGYGDPEEMVPGMKIETELPFKSSFKAFTLYFPDGLTEAEAKRIVDSITLE